MKKDTSNIIVAEPWETTNNPVRNTNHQYLRFINTAVFSEPARFFLKHGYYTSAPYGSKDWIDYWDREEERCLNGYSVGGVRITGRHYFFLNYSLLKARPIDPVTGLEKDAKKIITFPRFLDHQYYLFHEIEECFAEGPYKSNNLMGIIIAKSRRKGISFVNSGGVITYNYNFVPSSLTTIAAYEAVHYNTLLNGTHYVLNHLNKNTDWAKRRQRINRRDHFRASFVYIDDTGIEVEDGFMSEVQARSFKDDPFKAIGDSTYTMCFEEGGRFKGLLDAYTIAEPTFRDGDIMTGVPMIWGCVCAGTKVYDNNGREVLVEKLKKENGILGYEGLGVIKQPIIWKRPTTFKPCYRITTSGNKTIECSHDHPLLWSKLHFEKSITKNGIKTVRKKVTFKYAEDIKIGDQLMVCRQIPVFGTKQMWEPRLIGLLIGDGNYSYKATPQLSIADSEIFEWIEKSNLKIKIYKEFELKTGGTFKSVGIRAIQHELKELGIFGQSGNNKHLPKNIDDYDQYSLSELLGGYFDADGNVCENKKKNVIRIILTSKSNLLLEEVKHVLTKFSISCSIRKETRKTGYLPGNVYRLYISKHEDVRQFKKHIKFLCNRKQELLDKVSDTKSDMIYNNCYFEQSPSNKKGNYYLEHNNLSNLEAVVVKKVEFIGNQLVYNFNAGITHTYITNGFISGNTGGDVEAGGKDLEEMFYNPSAYGLKSYQNIYDENAVGNCGWFIDDLWYMPGLTKDGKHVLVDEHGNSYRELSEEILDAKRTVRASGSRAAYRKFVTQQPKCVSKDTFISHENGSNNILDLENKIINGKANLYELRTENDFRLTCTETHSIFNGTDYIELKNMHIGDHVKLFPTVFNSEYQYINIKTDIPIISTNIKINEEIAWFIGLFMGDGYFSGKDLNYELGIVFDKRDVESIEKCNSFFIKYFGSPGLKDTIGSKNGGIRLRITSKLLRYFMFSLDLVYYHKEHQRLKRNVHVPIYIMKSPKSVVSSFLNGVFDSDGGIYSSVKRIGLASKYEPFLRDLSILLMGFEIYVTNKQTNKFNGEGREFTQRSIFIGAGYVNNFAKHIRFTSKRKNDILDKYALYETKNREDRTIDKVKSITYIGVGEVFNLTTKCGYYGANGIWTHNSPKEAFLRIDSSPFDTLRAQSRLTDILTDQKTYISSIYTARFTVSPEGVIKYEYDATSVPLREFPIKDWNNVEGCPEIYEHPIKDSNGNIAPLRYIAGIDSYDADKSTTDSVGSMLVLDRLTDRIVCHYKGRPMANVFYETCRRILKYYNATANYERSNKGIYGYFYNMRCLHLLCDEPEILKEKGISKANTIGNNLKGTAPSLPVNAWGRELAALWSESPAYGEDAESEIVNMDKIRSLGLLREMLSYNDTGNFDDISALGMLMIYRENLMMTKVRKDTKAKSIMNDPFWQRHTSLRQPFTQHHK